MSVLTATRGDGGKFKGLAADDPKHPGSEALAALRLTELRAAASVLGLTDVALLDYRDKYLDTVQAPDAIGRIASHIRRVRPHVVVSFGPDGIYGHPDHIAISQFTAAAIVAAANPAVRTGAPDDAPHAVLKLYWPAWPQSTWTAHESAFKKWFSTVDGVERHATPWPDWMITTAVDARAFWPTSLRAVACHESQFSSYARLLDFPEEEQEALWGWQYYYRVFSLVNGGRARETHLFDGIADP